MKRVSHAVVFASIVALRMLHAQTDWPVFGHDSGGMRYSPLKQINAGNVAKLKLVWTFDTEVTDMPPPPLPAGRGGSEAQPAAAAARRPRARRSESTPLVIGDVMYLSTAYNRVLAMDPETGAKIWEYESAHTPALRGITYWPGTRGSAAADRFWHGGRLADLAQREDW
jgi:glucose dehydrogenase